MQDEYDSYKICRVLSGLGETPVKPILSGIVMLLFQYLYFTGQTPKLYSNIFDNAFEIIAGARQQHLLVTLSDVNKVTF